MSNRFECWDTEARHEGQKQEFPTEPGRVVHVNSRVYIRQNERVHTGWRKHGCLHVHRRYSHNRGMLKFATFDSRLNIKRLPLAYSLGDLSSIREIFTPEPGDVGRTQLPILPPQVETLSHGTSEFSGYLVEGSTALLVAIREFFASLVSQRQARQQAAASPNLQDAGTMRQQYDEAKRVCMNRIGARLLDVIKQDRRLGLYNLYWLAISKYSISILDQLIPAKKPQQSQVRVALQPIIMQTFQHVLQRVHSHLREEDDGLRHYSQYIRDTLSTHLGATFNYEFSRAIIAGQVHLLAPHIGRQNVLECAQAVFCGENDMYTMTYDDFLKFYIGVRSYIDSRLHNDDAGFNEMVAMIFRIPTQTVRQLPVEMLIFHPTIISLFAEEIKQLPSRTHKKSLFRNLSPQLGDEFGDDAWEFVVNDYLTFAKDLRRSEIIAFFRNRLVFGKSSPPKSSATGRVSMNATISSGIADKVSYRFDKGRIVNDLRGVSLIFLDLRGFTELSAGDITDEELKEHLYRFFDPVVNILNYFGGTIKNYAGDGILAAFHADSPHKNHALDAIRAAVEIYKFFVILQEKGSMAFQGMGIGIHSGLVEEAYFFFDQEAPGFNTVIGLAANLVGRLSSGKADKKKGLDSQTASALIETLITSPNIDLSLVANVEDMLRQTANTFQHRYEATSSKRATLQQRLSVKVVQGILNNQGIAISGVEHGTFERIRASVDLKEIESAGRVYYTYFDDAVREQLVFIKAGDASFKGIDTGNQGKFPVWGVYLERDVPKSLL